MGRTPPGGRRVVARLILAAAWIACAAIGAGPAAAGDLTEAGWRREKEATIVRLREAAKWCEEHKAFTERNTAYEVLLGVLPDDPAARRALRYFRAKNGKWQRAESAAKPEPTPADVAPQAAAKIADALAPARALVDEITAAEVPLDVRERVLEEATSLFPDAADLREANGEVKRGNLWVLRETANRFERRKQIVEDLEAARKLPEPERLEATAEENALGGPYVEAFGAPLIRVLGAKGTAEAKAGAALATQAHALYPTVFGEAPPYRSQRFFLHPTKESGLAAVAIDNRFTPAEREFASKLGAAYAPKTSDQYVWGTDGEWRKESVLKSSVKYWMMIRWNVNSTRNEAWAAEGFGHYFTDLIMQSHRIWTIREATYADGGKGPDFKAKLSGAAADWMLLARELEAGANWPGLRGVLTKDVNDQTAEDLLTAYVFARYLIEGRGEGLDRLLTAVGKPAPGAEGPEHWVPSQLDATVEGLDRRLRRWVRETALK